MGENNNNNSVNNNSLSSATSTSSSCSSSSSSVVSNVTSAAVIQSNLNASQTNLNNSNCSDNCNNNNNMIVNRDAEYLSQLLKEQKQIEALSMFYIVPRLIDQEIKRVYSKIFPSNNVDSQPLILPEPEGPIVTKQEKVYVPVKEYPDFNFVGRVLGPRGMTAKQLEQQTGCRVMVRGRGSMRDKKKEEQNRGKSNWEHLSEDLHVLITVEDTVNRGQVRLEKAVEEIKKLLIPVTEGEDELKKRQLMELAIMNGTYRDSNSKNILPTGLENEHMKLLPAPVALSAASLRPHAGTPLGAPLIISPRQYHVPTSSQLINGSAPPPLITPAEAGFVYAPYDFHQYATLTSHLLEYAQGDTNRGGLYGR